MITWKNVSFSYTEQEMGSLEDVDLTVSRGECILFCGRSGCGKTTLLRQVNGLIPNFFTGEGKGSVTLEGQETAEFPMYRLAEKVGSVFQNPRTQFFNVDTDSEIAFGIENEALPPEALKRRVELTVKELEIEELRGRSIFELSGGEKQKVAFASVYAMHPEVYLLDEPSSNLDLHSIEALHGYLQTIKRQGKTLLIAEHRLYYLMDLIDRAVYLEQGRIAGIYTAEELKKLSDVQRIHMGLRAADLAQVVPGRIGQDAAVIQSRREEKIGQPENAIQDRKGTHGERAALLELKQVALYYQKQVILAQISLKAYRGELIAVTGHNGAGKTTFSRALCGLHKECKGQFLWEGKTLGNKGRQKKSYLVMQEVGYELFAESVEKECVFGIRNPDRRLAEQTLEELGLTAYRERHPNTLSGGQKQRLAAAVSMVCGKEILVFDEPTSGLDHDSMAQVAALMEKLAEQRKLIFVVTHDYELICRVCTRLLYFDNGKLEEDLAVTRQNTERIQKLFGIGSLSGKQEE